MNIGTIEFDFNHALPACLIVFTQPSSIKVMPTCSNDSFGFTVLYNDITLFRFADFATSVDEAIAKAREFLMAIKSYVVSGHKAYPINDALMNANEILTVIWIDLIIEDLQDFCRQIPTRG